MSYTFGLDARNRVASYSASAETESPKFATKPSGTPEVGSSIKQTIDANGLFRYSVVYGFPIDTVMNAAQPKYIDVPYDPYPVIRWGMTNSYVNQWQNFDLKTQIGDDKWKALWDAYKFVPRRVFEEMACDVLSVITTNVAYRNKSGKEILSKITFKNFILSELMVLMTASHLIDIFIRSNLEAMTLAGITNPNSWEEKKFRSYAVRDVADEVKKLEAALLNDSFTQGWMKDELQAKVFEKRIEALPRAKDPLMNLQRDVTLAALVKEKEWLKLNLLCAMYEKMDSKLIEAMSQI